MEALECRSPIQILTGGARLNLSCAVSLGTLDKFLGFLVLDILSDLTSAQRIREGSFAFLILLVFVIYLFGSVGHRLVGASTTP